ncbi:hypothetical protein AAFF_G00089370 [Aldrovandia affinis]|uniref:Ubiquitin carboxyl-terminal hydrolase n=1 Tax=Aldrovandia affinis TaxID=143900 RepID=A0AAD7RW59_9TELE|nr:hypothetical protein AAFF_G00089370 [Aldrovandia affinis]
MGKKRGKEKNFKEEDAFDFTGPSCVHIRKGIDQSLLRKTSADVCWDTCQDCKEENASQPLEDDELNGEAPMIWVCLKCSYRGCGRNSKNQHAIKHYEKPRSDPHCLVLSLDNWSVWCYICDDEVTYSSTGQLAQLVNNFRKQALSDPLKTTPVKKVKEEDSQVEDSVVKRVPEKESKVLQKKEVKKEVGDSKCQRSGMGGMGPTVSVRGLSNLGNTCFFNAVIQNLSQTQLLRQILSDVTDGKISLTITPESSTELEPVLIQLEQPGSLTLAMRQLLNEIQETKKGVVTPRELFTQVCKKAARFKGFQQQDSQELLRYLLDGMRAEETKRVSSGIMEAMKRSGKNTDAEESNKLIKEYEKKGAPKNFVDQVFGGELTSTIMCKECKTVSSVTEMFLDLSLPVSDESYRKKNQKKTQKSSEGKASDQDSPILLTNGSEDIPTGAGSKYQQKKAKKQAKKQAKNQRRQQKQGGKVTLDAITNQDSAEPVEDEETASQGERAGSRSGAGAAPEGEVPAGTGERQGSREPGGDGQGGENAPEEEEEMAECEEDGISVASNRFTALSEGHSTEEGDNNTAEDKLEEEEDVPLTKEEDHLAEGMTQLSLNSDSIALEDIQLDLESGDVPVDTREYTVVNQDPELAFHSLATRVALEKQECSVSSCLFQFTEVENLTKNNSLLCLTCTRRQSHPKASDGPMKKVYTDALKQMLISSPPPVLTLHLKRFQQISYSVCKVNRHVQFPQILDLAPFCSVNCKNVPEGQTQVLYSLYGIVEHSGTMRSGHYTAYVKARPSTLTTSLNGPTAQGESEALQGSWYHVSDTSVQLVPETKVQSSQAYLLFYERVS